MIIEMLKRFWKKHIVDDFPYPEDCFDCDKADCSSCDENCQKKHSIFV